MTGNTLYTTVMCNSAIAMREMTEQVSKPAAATKNPIARSALIAFGWINVGFAFVGVALPGLPTTPFLLVAVWAFSRSSQRFHDWLYNHPRFGPTLRAWRDHRVVSVRAKALAVTTMALSLFFVIFFVAEDWVLPAVMACVMLPVATWLVTRASRVKTADIPVAADSDR